MYVKYESSITNHSKAMANVKVFADKQTDRQTNGQAINHMPPICQCGGHKNNSLLCFPQSSYMEKFLPLTFVCKYSNSKSKVYVTFILKGKKIKIKQEDHNGPISFT